MFLIKSRYKIILAITIIINLFTTSCKTDFDITAEWKDIPVVYCLINDNDTAYYVRVHKSFLGDADAYSMAKYIDSIYYKDCQIKLERILNNNIIGSVTFSPITSIPKQTGIFNSDYNLIYKSPLKSLMPSSMNKLDALSDYKLTIFIPEKNIELTSTIKVFNTVNVIQSFMFMPDVSFLSTFDVTYYTTKNARLYELSLLLNYLEITATDTLSKQLSWLIASKASQTLAGGETIKQEVVGSGFYTAVASSIKSNAGVIKRIATTVDFIFTLGGDELYTYIQVSEPSNSLNQENPTFTNIENGIGIFSCRYDKVVGGKKIKSISLDSLAYGSTTKHLLFADHYDPYYYIKNYFVDSYIQQ